nr:MAG TPA: hypothetical protein [Caudoviricetes sp.]
MILIIEISIAIIEQIFEALYQFIFFSPLYAASILFLI